MLRIGLDMDDTINEWYPIYLERFGQPKTDSEITYNVQNILIKDKEFWLSLPVKNVPNFEVTLICTKRVNKKSWTKQWLQENLHISPPVYQMYYQHGNKADMIKGRCDVFIDDSLRNVKQCLESGMPCLWYKDAKSDSDPTYTIYSLDIEEIYNKYIENFGPI